MDRARRILRETSRELSAKVVIKNLPLVASFSWNLSANFEDSLMKTLCTIGETIRNSNLKGEVIHTFGKNIVKKLRIAD